jgi:hypothetical protein
MRARDVAHGRVSPPPYSPYTNAEAGQWSLVRKPPYNAPMHDFCGSHGKATW